MGLYRIGYRSAVRDRLNKPDIRDILGNSIENNKERGLTGALLFNQNVFLQILEGRRTAINRTYQNIIHDDRHDDLELVGMEPIEDRVFDSWSMALIEDSPLTRKIMTRFCGADKPVIDNLTLATMTEMMSLMVQGKAES